MKRIVSIVGFYLQNLAYRKMRNYLTTLAMICWLPVNGAIAASPLHEAPELSDYYTAEITVTNIVANLAGRVETYQFEYMYIDDSDEPYNRCESRAQMITTSSCFGSKKEERSLQFLSLPNAKNTQCSISRHPSSGNLIFKINLDGVIHHKILLSSDKKVLDYEGYHESVFMNKLKRDELIPLRSSGADRFGVHTALVSLKCDDSVTKIRLPAIPPK